MLMLVMIYVHHNKYDIEILDLLCNIHQSKDL